MNEEKKGFNLSVLISMLVGVISLIVIIPTVTMIMSKNRPEEVTPEEYRILINKNQDYGYELEFNGNTLDISSDSSLYLGFSDLDNLISLSITRDDIVITLSYPDEEDQNNFKSIIIYKDIYSSSNYMFTYLDPVSNDKLYGTYDFSNITITEADQVLNPIYTPF